MIASLKYGLILLLVICFSHAKAKSEQALLDSAYHLYDYENFDDAKSIFQSIYKRKEANESTKLDAISGLLKIAVFKVKLVEADSIYGIGNSILNQASISIPSQLRFKQATAELFRSQAKFDDALNMHQKVLSESKTLKNEPLITAYANLYVAATLERISESDSALVYAQNALSHFLKLFPEDHVKLSAVYNMLGSCYYRLSNYDKATEYYLKTVVNTKKNIKQASYYQTMAYGNLAAVVNNLGNYEEALEYNKKALAINKLLGEKDGMGFNYFSLAVTYYYLGDYGRSKDYANACLAIRKELYDANHYRMAAPTELLGIVYELSENYELAIEYLKKAKAIKINNLGKDNIEIAYSDENIAICNLKLGSIDTANYYIQLANALLPAKISKDHLSLGTHYFTLSNIKLLQKDYAAAHVAIQKSKKIHETLGLIKTNEYAQNLALEASIYAEQKEFSTAQDLFNQAIAVIRLDKNASITSTSFPLSETALNIINWLVEFSFEAYLSTKDNSYLEQTKQYSAIFLTINDNYRKQFNDPYTKTTISQRSTKGMQLGVGIHYQLHQQQPSELQKEVFFKYAEMGRTALFRDLIDDYKVSAFAGIPDTLLQKEQNLKVELAELNQKIAENPENDSLKQQLFAIKEQFNQHIENYNDINPNYYNLKFKQQNITIKDIQEKVLKPDENLIEYVVDDTAFYAILIQKNKISIHHLANRNIVTHLIEQWRKSITSVQLKTSETISHQLYQLLIQPFSGQLSGNRLIIVPTHALFYLNFESLCQTSKPNTYMIYDYIIHYGLSSNVLYQQMQQKNTFKGVPVIVAPGFEADIKTEYQKSVALDEELDEEYLKTVRQPWSVKFANFISRKYKGMALIGDGASEANVKQNLSNHAIIHFATHAIADESDPLRSKLVLSKDTDGKENDGYLHTYEIYNLNLQTELAVLSACESGIGNLQKGEGMISLAYSMNYAGCPNVIMSLWKIDEKTNSEITTNFYNYLAKGNDISSALRLAKLDYLKNASGTLTHPFYWSGLVLMGKNSTIDLPSSAFNWKMMLAIIIILTAAFFAFTKFKKNKL